MLFKVTSEFSDRTTFFTDGGDQCLAWPGWGTG